MAKFSVKKPLTVFVVVLAIVVLGVVAYLRMTPDLLPNMDFPYVVIVTTDPGASPESVEETITRPMEQSMATLDRIKTVTSTTQNSVSMVMLEFEDGVNMDTISVDIQQKISILQGQWSDSVGAPYVLKINPSMIPVMVAAVSQEGKDVYALSDFVTDELTGKLEGVSGVAGVTVSGALTREAHVILDQEKMDALSATLEDAVKDQLKKAEGKLRDAEKKVTDGQQALADAKRAAADGVAESVGDAVDKVYDKLKDIYGVLEDTDIDDIVGGFITDPDGTLKKLNDDLKTLQGSMEKLMKALKSGHLRAQVEGDVSDLLVELMDGMTQMTGAELQLSEAKAQIESGLKQIQAAYDKVAEQTDLGGLLSISTVSGLLTAQNFSMPAGYVKDESGESWLLKVGEEYDSVDDIRGALLLHVEGYGDVRLSDVADVEIIDNAADSYTRLNGEQASVLKIYKDDSSSAGDVSANCLDAFKELEAQYEGLHVVVLSNQGNYISILIKSILTSMLVGAALAIVVLAIFLKDVKPTLVVGVSIPLSVLFAVVLMYFTNLDMNVMTLAGLSLGIGMLVAGGNWIKFGVVLIVFGAFLAWWSKNLHHTLARDFIDAVEADESMGGRYRRVAANEDGLMVWGKSGKSQFFPFDKLDHVLDGERIFVAMFADQGVTIPKDTFVRGDAEQFGSFLKARINKKLRIETKRKKMKAEKAAAEAKQGDKPQETKGKQRKQKKNKKKR